MNSTLKTKLKLIRVVIPSAQKNSVQSLVLMSYVIKITIKFNHAQEQYHHH